MVEEVAECCWVWLIEDILVVVRCGGWGGIGDGGPSKHGVGGVFWEPPYIGELGKVGTLCLFMYLHGCCQVMSNMCMGEWGEGGLG